ncbi:MAG: VOC family protein [Deltaproteobacteria bacterium]|nr:VOC family protein [Deltaproteobacteria bacterium]
MPYHHLALATRDMPAIHKFYSKAMGFDLVKVERGATPEGGFAKHFFFDTGAGEMMAFWELHVDALPQDFETGLSKAVGLPQWVNHVAFAAESVDDLMKRKQRLLDCGYDVLEIDHNWCRSIYVEDPNGTLVEFCVTTAEFDAADAELAKQAVLSDDIELREAKADVQFHRTTVKPPVHLGQD